MKQVTMICVGKLKEKFYAEAAAEYVKRLSRYCRLTVIELPEQRLPDAPAPAGIQRALAKEAEAIRAKIPPSSYVIALCIEGRLRSSEELARQLDTWSNRGEKRLVFLIGGSYGLHPSVKSEAGVQLSMSPMTFPHHLARVMLLEQLYRGFQILEGGKYHK
ncbi:MAG: 23S rRNA (pseudouridine(1915)-N(3))-methyltransferase RlmH [Oscillospiraceae bacterium]|nr:23S rRNA (pseudouridine(1915)-N(3))-methyltransferase RlmH [Oscillospiraceae bacterium]